MLCGRERETFDRSVPPLLYSNSSRTFGYRIAEVVQGVGKKPRSTCNARTGTKSVRCKRARPTWQISPAFPGWWYYDRSGRCKLLWLPQHVKRERGTGKTQGDHVAMLGLYDFIRLCTSLPLRAISKLVAKGLFDKLERSVISSLLFLPLLALHIPSDREPMWPANDQY